MSTVDILLKQQTQELERFADLLDQEYDALKQRQHEQLLSLAQIKAATLQRLSKCDEQLKVLKNEFTTQHKLTIESLREQVTHLKKHNERNGKLLALSAASQNRLRSLMVPADRRASTTYTKDGHKQHSGKGNCHFAV